MNIRDLRGYIAYRRKNGETYQTIADDYNTSRAHIKYIETHPDYKPSRIVSKRLGLELSDDYTRTRREMLNEIARMKGCASWCAYETQELDEYKKGLINANPPD